MKITNISKTKQFGILLVIIGVFIPSLLYPLTSLTTSATLTRVAFAMKGVSYDISLRDLEVVLVKGEWKDNNQGAGYYEGRLAIRYKYTIALGIVLVFIGIGILALYRSKR